MLKKFIICNLIFISSYSIAFSPNQCLNSLKRILPSGFITKNFIIPTTLGASVPILSTFNKKTELTFKQYSLLSNLSGIGYALTHRSKLESSLAGIHLGSAISQIILLNRFLDKANQKKPISSDTNKNKEQTSSKNIENKEYEEAAKIFLAGISIPILLYIIVNPTIKKMIFSHCALSIISDFNIPSLRIQSLITGLNCGFKLTTFSKVLLNFLKNLIELEYRNNMSNIAREAQLREARLDAWIDAWIAEIRIREEQRIIRSTQARGNM